jgi:hypothetical protein
MPLEQKSPTFFWRDTRRFLAAFAIFLSAGPIAGCVERPADLDISSSTTYHSANYVYADALFMANPRAVLVAIQGDVPGMSARDLQEIVVAGMRTPTHDGFYGGQYNWNFASQAPVSFESPRPTAPPADRAGDSTAPYHVVWRFDAATARDVTAEASLYRGAGLLRSVRGHVVVRDDPARPQAVPYLVKTVESRLAMIPDLWMAPAGGG